MKKDKISVIMPVYNTEKYLKQSIESVLNQTYDNIELIIINDGSTDKSEKIIKNYLNRKNVIYKKINNSGVAHARNIGLSLCSGKYIAFIDSDDSINIEMYEKLYNKMIEANSDIVFCAYNKVFSDHIKSIFPQNKTVFENSVINSKNILLNSTPYIPLKLFKKELIEKNKITFDEDLRIFEDLLFCYKLFLLANKISYVDEALYNYNCTNEHSLTNKFTNKMFDVFIALDRLKEFAESKYSYDLEKQLEYISIKHISLRFTSKTADRKSLLEYVDKSFEYLKVNYPNYKKSVYYKGIKGFIKKNKLLVKLLVIKNNL